MDDFLAKRIIPCLDIRNNQVVKGVNFLDIRNVGDPVEMACKYNSSGADELVFLDIDASREDRRPILDLLERVADSVFIPLTLGGGIRSISDARDALSAGADKVSINSAAVKNPALIKELADKVGAQAVVLAVDAKFDTDVNRWFIYTHGGKVKTDIDALEWCEFHSRNGAGEVLLTSMDADGTKKGFDIELLRRVNELMSIPLIASGGVGSVDHFVEASNYADAFLAASVFHFGELSVLDVKRAMASNGVRVRL